MKKINVKKCVSVLVVCCVVLCFAYTAKTDRKDQIDRSDKMVNTYITVYAVAPEDELLTGKDVIVLDENGYRLQSCDDLVNGKLVEHLGASGGQCDEVQLIRCDAVTREILSQEIIWRLTPGEHVSVGLVCANDAYTDETVAPGTDVVDFVMKIIYHDEQVQYVSLGGHVKSSATYYTIARDEEGWKKIDTVAQSVKPGSYLTLDEDLGYNPGLGRNIDG